MPFTRFSEAQHDLVRYAAQNSNRLRNAAELFMNRLRTSDVLARDVDSWGLIIDEPIDGVFPIRTPFGTGRAVIHTGVDDMGPQATLVFVRQSLDLRDQKLWEPVWSLRFTEGGLYAGDDTENPFKTSEFGLYKTHAEVALSVLYAFAKV